MAKKEKHKKKNGKSVVQRQTRAELKKDDIDVEQGVPSKDAEYAEIERHENLERDLTYAKSEIGKIALRFLKNTSLPQRIAGVGLIVVLSIGVGVAVSFYQIHSVPNTGSGILENDSVADVIGTSGDIVAQNVTSKKRVTFTKEEDGVYRWHHSDADFYRHTEQWDVEYVFNVPSELRVPPEPYVMHLRIHRRGDVATKIKPCVDLGVFSSPEDDNYELNNRLRESIPYGRWSSVDVVDSYVPFFFTNPHVKEEFSWITLNVHAVDVDIELMPVSQASLPTWDGHSRLENGVEGSGLFRVTGPITATKLTTGDRDSVAIYGYRQGDISFTKIADASEYIPSDELSGQSFTTGPNTLDGVELIWVYGYSFIGDDMWRIE